MSDPAVSAGVAPMEGDGVYNRSSTVQAAGQSPALPLLERAAEAVSIDASSEAIVVADYGASEGHNSLAPMAAAIRALRTRVGAERPISVVHDDLPTSDFNTLFRTLAEDPASYLRGDPATFASAVGRSFYEQVLPADSVTLGWSAWAVQWLSRIPCPIPDQLQVAYSDDPDARAAYASQATEDWETFLTHRGAELRPGGRLVVVTMALTDAGDFGYRAVLTAMYAALEQRVAEGLVRRDEAVRMAIPTVGRSRANLLAPFSASGRFAGLTVEHAAVFLGEDTIWKDFERDRDAQAFGARWAAFSRASVVPTLANALDGGADDPRRNAFVGRMEAGMKTRLAADPKPTIIPLATIVLAK